MQGIEAENVTPYHIGFVLGPCINASGRLDTAEHSLKLLCAKTREEAAKLAGDLKDLNESRKELTRQGEAKAIELVETSPLQNDKVLVVYLPDCHESLAGIIAGRLREHFHKPSFVLTRSEEGVKGSGRSIEAYSMYEELCKCKELMTKFGGHPMAAGLSLAGEEMIEPFRRALNDNSTLTEEDFVEKVVIDVPMPITYITKNLIRQLSLLEPFGKGNMKPLFAQKGLTVLNYRIFGKNRNVVKVQLADAGGYQMDGVYFGRGRSVRRIRGCTSDPLGSVLSVDRYVERTRQITDQYPELFLKMQKSRKYLIFLPCFLSETKLTQKNIDAIL